MIRQPNELFTKKVDAYDRYVSSFLYPQGLRAYFERVDWLRAGLRILDAGCGSGIPGLALLEALERRGLEVERFDAFDLTSTMLGRFRERLVERAVEGVELREANVLELDTLPASWTGYDLVLCASMLEYVPRERLPEALGGLRSRLADGRRLLLFMTRRNWVTKLLVERPWGGNRYSRSELAAVLTAAGFEDVAFSSFPSRYAWLNLWGHIVEARALTTGGAETVRPDEFGSG
jgi:SAM-dependent methyltransferase